MGVSQADAEAHLARNGYGKDADTLEIWEQHCSAFETYGRCQFNAVGTSEGIVFLGINATEIETAARALGIEFTSDLIDDVQTIARGAREVLNERKK